MRVQVSSQPFDPLSVVATYVASQPNLTGRYGASTIFIGTMRDFNDGTAVDAMTLEHYPAMTEKQLARIAQAAADRWSLTDVLVVHRYGELRPGDPIVLVAVWAARRAEAFAGCRHIIDELKTRAPFWKRERTADGDRWVEPETGR